MQPENQQSTQPQALLEYTCSRCLPGIPSVRFQTNSSLGISSSPSSQIRPGASGPPSPTPFPQGSPSEPPHPCPRLSTVFPLLSLLTLGYNHDAGWVFCFTALVCTFSQCFHGFKLLPSSHSSAESLCLPAKGIHSQWQKEGILLFTFNWPSLFICVFSRVCDGDYYQLTGSRVSKRHISGCL